MSSLADSARSSVHEFINTKVSDEAQYSWLTYSRTNISDQIRFKFCHTILSSLPSKMCQSYQSLLIAHSAHERILTSTFRWLASKKWYGKPVTPSINKNKSLKLIFKSTKSSHYVIKPYMSFCLHIPFSDCIIIMDHYMVKGNFDSVKFDIPFLTTSVKETLQAYFLCINTGRIQI